MREPLRKGPKDPLDHEPEGVAYARRNAGLTQSQLAEMCGVTQPHISEIENGTRNATPAMLNRLAAALNCPRVILERKREPEATTAIPRPVPESGVRRAERTDERRIHEEELPEVRDASVERTAS